MLFPTAVLTIFLFCFYGTATLFAQWFHIWPDLSGAPGTDQAVLLFQDLMTHGTFFRIEHIQKNFSCFFQESPFSPIALSL
jgi:hypothetical protein